ncbi:hypothetical protein D3OALGA1CA_2777 [Olavius algarvensis associated proteobacterium Delta 3]|nr:hypothetical protein D3OALGB2SA_796 [Olavius algarvensis associated proteobacterium Delta 3]CAB5124123.1 hypothetical protein D3OALGA1CA_2777 [Olavius algarvensis associated proteobacterium Delta 3]
MNPDPGCSVLDSGYSILDAGYSMLVSGCWMLVRLWRAGCRGSEELE